MTDHRHRTRGSLRTLYRPSLTAALPMPTCRRPSPSWPRLRGPRRTRSRRQTRATCRSARLGSSPPTCFHPWPRPAHARATSAAGLSRAALAPHVPGQLCRPRAGPRADATHLPAAARKDVGPLRRRVVYAAASRARITKHPLWAAHALSAAPARRRRRVREAGQVRRRAAGLLRLRARRVRGRRRRVRAGRAAAGRAGAPLVAARVRDALGVVGAAAAAHLQLLPGAASRAARASACVGGGRGSGGLVRPGARIIHEGSIALERSKS